MRQTPSWPAQRGFRRRNRHSDALDSSGVLQKKLSIPTISIVESTHAVGRRDGNDPADEVDLQIMDLFWKRGASHELAFLESAESLEIPRRPPNCPQQNPGVRDETKVAIPQKRPVLNASARAVRRQIGVTRE